MIGWISCGKKIHPMKRYLNIVGTHLLTSINKKEIIIPIKLNNTIQASLKENCDSKLSAKVNELKCTF